MTVGRSTRVKLRRHDYAYSYSWWSDWHLTWLYDPYPAYYFSVVADQNPKDGCIAVMFWCERRRVPVDRWEWVDVHWKASIK
jgi:hypothetical protein